MGSRIALRTLVALTLITIAVATAQALPPTFCEDTSAPQCGGICAPGSHCADVSQSGATTSAGGPGCACVPDGIITGDCGLAPQCGGDCEIGSCLPASEIFGAATTQGELEPCLCFAQICGLAPQCGGDCGQDEACLPIVVSAGATTAKDSGATTQGPMENPCVCAPRGEPGACCLPDAPCQQLEQFECLNAGGSFAGEGTTCSPDPCRGTTVYQDSECASPFEDISATGSALVLGDDAGQVVPLGFTFEFYSATHTSVGVSSNGYLGFSGFLTIFGNVGIPNPDPPNNFIAPLWEDLNPNDGGKIYYQTLGTAPNRRFIAQWTAVPEFSIGGANTLQAVLFEGSNTIEFRYGPLSAADGTIGVENPSGFQGTAVPRAGISQGDCILLAPGAAPSAAEAPALDRRSTALLVLVLLSIALWALRRTVAPRRG